MFVAYSYLQQQAAFAYDSPPGAAEHYPAAEAAAAAAGIVAAQTPQARLARRALRGGDDAIAELPAGDVEAAEAAEDGEQAQDEHLNEEEERDQQQQQQQRSWLSPWQQQPENEQPEQEAGQPEAGSYSAALLRAFEPGAAAAAHEAARSLKVELMQQNVEVARQFLLGAAARAAAAALEATARAGTG